MTQITEVSWCCCILKLKNDEVSLNLQNFYLANLPLNYRTLKLQKPNITLILHNSQKLQNTEVKCYCYPKLLIDLKITEPWSYRTLNLCSSFRRLKYQKPNITLIAKITLNFELTSNLQNPEATELWNSPEFQKFEVTLKWQRSKVILKLQESKVVLKLHEYKVTEQLNYANVTKML